MVGWVTVGVYLIAAGAAAAMAARGWFPDRTALRERAFWSLAAVLLVLLGINKQLDLQSFLTAVGRCDALAQGWYEDRRAIQRMFILVAIGVGAAGLLATGLLLRETLARTGIALLGLGFVTIFVVTRAASFHHMDALINTWIGGVRINWVLELFGPLLVIAAALRGFAPSRT
ncbi:isopropylmalate isomerase [Tabrizicola sp.]|uniref:isopropylmalate isomerase n=1 Tax=Tabrizicola sp. TaxID=2005166 RepID=UPI00286D3383|nr:isopropylmalate isomerase [Tabrizicola sp.]